MNGSKKREMFCPPYIKESLKCISGGIILFVVDLQKIIYDSGRTITFYERLMLMVFGSTGVREREAYPLMVSTLSPVIAVLFLYGTYLYKTLHISNVYIFIRIRNRAQWMIKNILKTATALFIYVTIMMIVASAMILFISGLKPEKEELFLVFKTIILLFLFCVMITLFNNLIALRFGSSKSVVITIILMAFFSVICIDYEKFGFHEKFFWIMKLNPMGNLICTWDINQYMVSILYYSILNLILSAILIVKVKTGDFALLNREV